MRTVGDDKVVRVVAQYDGQHYPKRWYYNLSVREAIRRYKVFYGIKGKRGVEINIS